ncbi:hypothetical protein [Litoreibacter roseus]|uniref:Uncharacterized protein n=1 Tax=Litoreibacter roseus TaxID=2601869 RepID=A0A6N6JH49_9RHOB|nr:hypothetical protein [Litoreibacter roseus]GFE65444.1 hypothetical protein KIN_25180 [Litoreibacter roseus]
MTALTQFERLETTGLWRESPEAQRRDVIVSFGKASLIIRDRTDTALTHWSLPAIERINPGQRPAMFEPGAESGETLELDDDTMITAIEKVRKTIARKKPRHGRVRLAILVSILSAIAALGVFWLPDALIRHTVSVVPDSTRLSIGNTLLDHLTRLTGETCRAGLGPAALSRLKARTLGDGLASSGSGAQARRLFVVPGGPQPTLSLPGQIIVLNQTLVEDYDTPAVAAGFILAATDPSTRVDPLRTLLDHAGLRATFGLLTTGHLDQAVLSDYAQVLLTQEAQDVDPESLLARFEAARIASSPYAYAKDITGEATLTLIEADPMRGQPAPRLLSDGDWISLQSICGE